MGSKTNKIGHQAVHLTIAKVITTLITMASSMLLSRYCTKAEYGTYSQMTIIITLLTSLIMLGLPNSINYFLAKKDGKEERRHFLSVYYTFNTVLAIIVGVIAVVGVPLFIYYFKNENLKNYLYFLGIYPWVSITIASISNVLVVYGKTKKLMLLNVLNAAAALASIGITYIFTLSFNIFLISFLVLHAFISIWVYVIVSRLEKGIKPEVDLKSIKQILAYSIPIGLASLVGTITVETDKLMIGGFIDTESLAVYTNAAKELPLTMAAASLTAVLLPKMAKKLSNNETEEGVRLWKTTISVSYIIMCFFSVSCIVFAPQIMTILYSEKYISGVNVFRVYSCILLLRTTYFGTVLSCTGNTKYIFFSSLLSLGLNIVLNFLFYKFFGFIGPAIASFVSIVVVALFQLIHSSRIIHVKLRNLFPWRDLLLTSLINIAWGVAAFFATRFFNVGINKTGIIISIAAGVGIALVYFLAQLKRIKSLWGALNNE